MRAAGTWRDLAPGIGIAKGAKQNAVHHAEQRHPFLILLISHENKGVDFGAPRTRSIKPPSMASLGSPHQPPGNRPTPHPCSPRWPETPAPFRCPSGMAASGRRATSKRNVIRAHRNSVCNATASPASQNLAILHVRFESLNLQISFLGEDMDPLATARPPSGPPTVCLVGSGLLPSSLSSYHRSPKRCRKLR